MAEGYFFCCYVRIKFLTLVSLTFFLSCAASRAQAQATSPKKSPVSAVFAFGDSTVDPGNNNFIPTPFRCNFPPYGRDFFTHEPTGRFTNGKLVTDFAASYLGIKEELPPYLDWSLGVEELTTGVSFGSGGSGFDPFTAQIGSVIPVSQQLTYFREYVKKLDLVVGVDARRDIIRRAIFCVSAGTNDFIAFATLPIRRQSFSIEGYQGFILQNVQELLQGLSDLEASRIFVVGLPAIGCLPIIITLSARDGIHDRGCILEHNAVADVYNKKLQVLLQDYAQLRRVQIVYADVYTPLINAVQAPIKYGFEDSKAGCCGTGLIEASILCNPNSLVCFNASKYVFWDSIHPTEKMYRVIFDTFRMMIDQLLKSY
ncbi:GDSL esterase/lipase isoform X2 [Iris pallida]|uniref:GDSL esterase/lipase isoform X2 n=1 Tax=Iris pallida TaxID=29817 RepID=A0AAX6E0D8_IRIPA|nr:GDSL esterase/lipase isoform X2 [Iris pallida]